MKRRKREQPSALPATRSELRDWIRERLPLEESDSQELSDAIDAVFVQHERQWQKSKDDALHAVSQSLSRRIGSLRDELSARDTTVQAISRYFEQLVADLTDRIHRDPKTGLATFPWFIERLEAFLKVEQREGWCMVGLVDIRSFKTLNDTLGHATGDLIITQLARLLREHVRAEDLLARQGPAAQQSSEVHARFGGDEFCFLSPDLTAPPDSAVVVNRFRLAVERHDWTTDDPRLAEHTVTIDTGIVCLAPGLVADRKPAARQLARDLVALADAAMYRAKINRATQTEPSLVRIEGGRVVEID